MDKLRIGIVTQSYYPYFGGVTEHVHHVALALERRGHHVTVVTGGRENALTKTSIRVRRAGRTVLVPCNGSRGTVTLGFGLRDWLRDLMRVERFDLISCQCPLTPTLPLIAVKHAHCPVVGTFHSSAKSNLGYAIFRRLLRPYHRRLSGKIAVSEPARDFVRGYFGGEYRIIPNGVDTNRFSPQVPALERFDDGTFNVLYVGRLDKRKGLGVLISSLHRLWASEGEGVRLIIVGDGSLRRRLMASVPAELRGAVSFEGAVSPDLLPRYYASSHVVCSPATRGESFGIVLLEAMSSGVPVIASDIPGYRTVMRSGVQGVLVEPGSASSLAAALCLLARDDSLRLEMAAAGRETAQSYSWDVVAGEMEEYFLEVVEAHAGRRQSVRPGEDGAGRGPSSAPAARDPHLVNTAR